MSEKQWAACPFCNIINGRAEATVLGRWPSAIAITPLNPVTNGHVLIIPKKHVANYMTDPATSAKTMAAAADYAFNHRIGSSNLITSAGVDATQTVQHLHIHIVPRAKSDGLPLPWTPQQEAIA